MSYNILIVDDSAIVRAVIKRTLTIAGIEMGEVYEAGNGKEALQQLEGNWIDLVFADINMPEMNGIELVEQMKTDPTTASIPVVIVSTEKSVNRIEDLMAKGIKGYLNKPFTPESLRDIVNETLETQND